MHLSFWRPTWAAPLIRASIDPSERTLLFRRFSFTLPNRCGIPMERLGNPISTGSLALRILVSSQIGNIPYYLQGGLWKKLNIDSLSALPDALGHLMMGTVIDITMFFNQNQLQQSQFGDLEWFWCSPKREISTVWRNPGLYFQQSISLCGQKIVIEPPHTI